MTREAKGYEYRGPRVYCEGIPFGDWLEYGDHYVTSEGNKIHPDDVELVPRDKCHAMALAIVKNLRRRVRERKGVTHASRHRA